MDRSSKQKINKETQVLNDTLNEMDLIDIFSTFHPNAEKYTFFLSAHGTFSRIDHILGHRSNLSKFNKTEIISSIFSDNNAMRLLLLLLLLLSRFSRVRLCATPWTAAHWAPPSLGFSRQEHWSCHCLLQCMKVKSESEVAQSGLT